MEEATDKTIVEGMVEGIVEGIIEGIIDLARRRRKMEKQASHLSEDLASCENWHVHIMVVFLVCF